MGKADEEIHGLNGDQLVGPFRYPSVAHSQLMSFVVSIICLCRAPYTLCFCGKAQWQESIMMSPEPNVTLIRLDSSQFVVLSFLFLTQMSHLTDVQYCTTFLAR